jgi:hypothetical protein
MYFSHPSPYELGGSPDIEAEDAVLADHDIKPYTGREIDLLRLEGTDPIDMDGVKGFSLTAFPFEPIDQRLGIADISTRLSAGLEGTFYDRIIGSAEIGPDGVVLSEPTMRPL